MTITVAPTFTTTDGKPFKTRKEAETHQKFITRDAAIKKALTDNGFNLADGAGTIGDAATFVAAHGDAFLAALTVPSNRGPKKGSTQATA